jgi:hypothetical protein
VNIRAVGITDCKDFTGSIVRSNFHCTSCTFWRNEKKLYRRVNGFRLNISPATCITTAVLYVEDDCFLRCDTVWSDTKPRVVTFHTSALMVEAVGSSDTLEPIYQTA